MTQKDIVSLSIQETHDALSRGTIRVRDCVEAYLSVIQEKDGDIHAYLEVFEGLEDDINRAQKRFEDKTATLLTGIPIAVKDNILIEGRRASAASNILEGFVSPYDATVIKKLKVHDPIFIGRTNMDEFAMGGSTENSAYGVTKNPIDTTRVPGGSSGGSAAAVSMNGACAALGTDTGGSVRQPASFCGCVGLKPTYGAVSRYGLIAMGSSLDQAGPITKTVADAKILFDAMKGKDSMDSTSYYPESISINRHKKIGVPKSLLSKGGIDEGVLSNFNETLVRLEKDGYEIVDVDLDRLSQALPAYYVVMFAEVSSNLARYDGVKFGICAEGDNLLDQYMNTRGSGLGKEVRRRILLGTYVLSSGYYDAYYGKATALREGLRKDFNTVLQDVDVILTPTAPTPAFRIGEKSNNPLEMYLADIFTVPANITGHPALSIPSGKTAEGLPLGVQCIGREYEEEMLFEIGALIETYTHGRG